MLCINPQGRQAWACGRCPACRINRTRDWTTRLILELERPGSRAFFLTLTYDDDHLPPGCNLSKIHVQHWIRYIRRKIPLKSLRYFVCGEYGEKRGRPHYHALLFVNTDLADPVSVCAVAVEKWSHGNVDVDTRPVTAACIDYVASYLVKGYYDIRTIAGREKPFRLTSPGHGGYAYDYLTSQPRGLPKEIAYYDKVLPVPKYIRRKAKEDGVASEPHSTDLPPVRLGTPYFPQDLMEYRKVLAERQKKAAESRDKSARRLKVSLIHKRRSQNEAF